MPVRGELLTTTNPNQWPPWLLKYYLTEVGLKRGFDRWPELSRRVAGAFEADLLVVYDNVGPAVPEGDREKLPPLPGYERHVIWTLVMSTGFDQGGMAVVMAPPHPLEMNYIAGFAGKVKGQQPSGWSFQVLYPYRQDEVIDLISYYEENPDRYAELCSQVANNPPKPTDQDYLKVVNQVLAHQVANQSPLVWPFLVTPREAEALDCCRLTPPVTDKAYYHLLMRREGLGELMVPCTIVGSDGQEVHNLYRYNEYRCASRGDDLQAWAKGVVEVVNRLLLKGMKPYLVPDSNGVSGLGHVFDGDLADILYNQGPSENEKEQALIKYWTGMGHDQPPAFSLVMPEVDYKYDVAVGGMVLRNGVYPTTIYPMILDGSEFKGGYLNSDLLPPKGKLNLLRGWYGFAEVMRKMGYQGPLALDMFVLPDGNGEVKILVHDPNLRRGGRSAAEALSALLGNYSPLMDVQLNVPFPPECEPFQAYGEALSALRQAGHYPYSTAFGYYPKMGSDGLLGATIKVVASGEVTEEQLLSIINEAMER